MVVVKSNLKLPENKGKLDIYQEICEGGSPSVVIIGDPDGLRYLSETLKALADYDQNSDSSPTGERAHIHLHRRCQLRRNSCEVEICRADAKGTGELPDFMK